MKQTKRLGIITAGGDCPGLNACLRAIVRTAAARGCHDILGIQRGYEGLINGDLIPLDSRSVSGVINRGGTILLSARSQEFETPAGMQQAAQQVKAHGLDGLIILGGNGSLRGAWEFSRHTEARIIGIPKTIDNDVGGTDFSIGFYTAVNTAVEAIDKIRDTATSHERVFLVEVMGRDRGFLALSVAIAAGAEEVIVPETALDVKALHKRLEQGAREGKKSSIVVVAEGSRISGRGKPATKKPNLGPFGGQEAGIVFEVANLLSAWSDYQVRVAVLGYQQRGGIPSAFDRILATRLGKAAVDALLKGQKGKMVGFIGGRVVVSGLERAWKEKKSLDRDLLELSRIMSH